MADRTKSIPTPPSPEQRAQDLLRLALEYLIIGRGIALYAARVPPAPASEDLARMETHEVPFTVAASIRKWVPEAVLMRLDEGVTMLEVAASETPARLEDDWNTWQ